MKEESEPNGRLSAVFWMRVASLTFGMWALVLPISAKIVVDDLRELRFAQRAQIEESVRSSELQERRILLLEERQGNVINRLRELEVVCSKLNAVRP